MREKSPKKHQKETWAKSKNRYQTVALRLCGLGLVGAILALVGWAQESSGSHIPVITGDLRVDTLLSELTLAEKISLIHGSLEPASTYQGQAGFLAGVPRLGIPSLRLADGPPGVLTRVPAAAPTSTMGLAATFSVDDARENGVLVARQAKARGIDVVLEPFINIDRDISFARAYNTFGEDPMLTGQIGASFIRGVQGLGILAQAKHYIGYDTDGKDVIVDQQTLHEIYLAPFADAVAADVSSIMCSYNQIDSLYSCGNESTLNRTLRGELGFRGFVTSDWGAIHDNTFINAGVDLEMPGPLDLANKPKFVEEMVPFFGDGGASSGNGRNMHSALRDGIVTEAAITRAVGRILLQMECFGLLDGQMRHQLMSDRTEENARTIERTAGDAAVLLKNDGNALPLKAEDLASLVLIGPGAGQTIATGKTNEKAAGLPWRQIGTFEALKRYTDSSKDRIEYAVADDMNGIRVPVKHLSLDGQPGLRLVGLDGVAEESNGEINFTRSNGKALPPNTSRTWSGTLQVPSSGKYRLYLQMLGCYASLSLDGKSLLSNGKMFLHGDITQAGQDDELPTTEGLASLRTEVELTSGAHELSVSVSPDGSNNPTEIRLNWVTPLKSRENYDAAILAAKHAKTAIVFAWSRDKPVFKLPGNQDQLIADVAAVNPNTIVVLNVCQPVSMSWLKNVKAVLNMWWPGDEGGWATAKVLLGKVSPAGRLPFTWGQRLEDYPATDPAHPERRADGPDGKTLFSEGIYVGYRWFDHKRISPLFPFGFGLSYSHFKYSGLKIARAADGGLDVSFSVQNIGNVTSDEVPQVYLDGPSQVPIERVQFADHALAAFTRISLNPSESRNLTLHVPRRSLEYWSSDSAVWVVATGTRRVHVGASSRDFRLDGSGEVEK